MKSLCSDCNQKSHLEKLNKLISDGTLDGTEAWSAFSAPKVIKVFTKNNSSKKVSFTKEEVKTYEVLRKAVAKHLFEKCSGSCSYCRRPVGHYGWAWHIEHVFAKSTHPSSTFTLSNLTVGCVHCNQWKGRKVDRTFKGNALPIIDPSLPGFNYSSHLSYVQISTDSLCFTKYSSRSPEGTKTYENLKFEQLERCLAINGMHPPLASLHDRIEKAIRAGLSANEGQELVDLLFELKNSIYQIK